MFPEDAICLSERQITSKELAYKVPLMQLDMQNSIKRKSGHAVFFYLQMNDADTINLSNQSIVSCELSCEDSAHSLQESFLKCHSVLDTSHHINCLNNTSNTHNTVFNFCRSA